jgi:hypothetical protein
MIISSTNTVEISIQVVSPFSGAGASGSAAAASAETASSPPAAAIPPGAPA